MWNCGKCNECDKNWLRRMRCLKCDKPCPRSVRTAAYESLKEDKGGWGGGGTGGGGKRRSGPRSARVSDNTFGTYLLAAKHGQQAAAKIAQLQKELKAAQAKALAPPLATAADVEAMARRAEAAGHGPDVVATLKAAAAKAETAAKEAASAKTPQQRYLEASKVFENAEAAREKQEATLVRIQAIINKQHERFDKAQEELGRLRTQSAAAKEERECAVRALPGANGPPGAASSSLDAPQVVAMALGPNVRSDVVAMPELQLILDEFRKAYAGKCAGIAVIERAEAERQEARAASQTGLPNAEQGVPMHEDVTLVVANDASTGPVSLAAPPQPSLPNLPEPAPEPFQLPEDQEQLQSLFAGLELAELVKKVNSMAVEAHQLGKDRYTPHGGEIR